MIAIENKQMTPNKTERCINFQCERMGDDIPCGPAHNSNSPNTLQLRQYRNNELFYLSMMGYCNAIKCMPLTYMEYHGQITGTC